MKRQTFRILLFMLSLCITGAFFPSPAPAADAAIELLKKHILLHNQEAMEEDRKYGSPMGEAGILRIKPEPAKALGMKVFVDPDYATAKDLLQKANKALDRAKAALSAGKKDKTTQERYKEIVHLMVAYRSSSEHAMEKLRAYHARLTPENDDRLDKAASEKALGQLLEKSLHAQQNRVRDALGYLFNRCQGLSPNAYPLTPENIRFVNGVFSAFVRDAPKGALDTLHLDRVSDYARQGGSSGAWKQILRTVSPRFVEPLEKAMAEYADRVYPVDPLLFMALMKRESLFDPRAVSYVGAAGLTQIMPQTGKDLGMTPIYLPEYFDDAVSLLKEERRTKQRAVRLLLQIQDEEKGLELAKRASVLMQKGLELGRKRERLFVRYKRELLKQDLDERLKPEKAIAFGYRYFAGLMRQQKGDISLALASYNAGPHRVRQHQGIPPYEETVLFRNKVLDFYREYLKKASITRE